MPAVFRRSMLLAILAMSVALLASGPGAVAASTYKKCSLSERDQDPPGEKPTYNLSLKRIGTSCATAKKVMYAFHKCRSQTAVGCSRKVLTHWTCRARKDSSTAEIFYATFTCTYGSRRVKSGYQQNT